MCFLKFFFYSNQSIFGVEKVSDKIIRMTYGQLIQECTLHLPASKWVFKVVIIMSYKGWKEKYE